MEITMLCGVIKTGKSYLHSLGSEFSGSTLLSMIKQIGKAILAKYIFENKEIVFAIDGSEVGNGCTDEVWYLAKRKQFECSVMHLVFNILHQLLGIPI